MNNSYSRRDFVKRASLLPLCAATTLGFGAATSNAIEPLKRCGGPILKASCNAYSFAKLLGVGGAGSLSVVGFAEYCAKVGFEGIDPTGYYFPGYEKNGPGVPTDKFIFELKKRSFELGLGISGTGI